MVLSRKQVLVLAGVILVLAAVSVGYQYYGQWHGNRAQPQGKAILNPPLQDLLLPLDTMVKTRMTWPTGEWGVVFETGADWDKLYGPVNRYLRSKGYELDQSSEGNLYVRRWNSPDTRFFVTLDATTPITGIPPKPGEAPDVYRYGICVLLPEPFASNQPPQVEEGP